MYCGAVHRIFVLQITDCPSTFVTLRADIAIETNNTGIPEISFKCFSTPITAGLPLVPEDEIFR
ncbi:hypothetical protein PILCRDRAFT_819346 [Piloderma croceum F 1598]|uniref:Uncharacterized protein n=1 Tax=Piloderma croceum (strain F 1598) TaxID=765440 RepID=A0A0C3FW09_PILCF|nr:hypothetical protein PILCRDRAFT_819346 [Piloderma croceum F 1598]